MEPHNHIEVPYACTCTACTFELQEGTLTQPWGCAAGACNPQFNSPVSGLFHGGGGGSILAAHGAHCQRLVLQL